MQLDKEKNMEMVEIERSVLFIFFILTRTSFLQIVKTVFFLSSYYTYIFLAKESLNN